MLKIPINACHVVALCGVKYGRTVPVVLCVTRYRLHRLTLPALNKAHIFLCRDIRFTIHLKFCTQNSDVYAEVHLPLNTWLVQILVDFSLVRVLLMF
jgi:hypothetical protein